MPEIKKEVRLLRHRNGRIPFLEWLGSLPNIRDRQRIQARIDRLSIGNFGDFRSVGGGVLELRLHFGQGFRIYVGNEGSLVVILISGGDKSGQEKDIKMARKLWKAYKEEGANGIS